MTLTQDLKVLLNTTLAILVLSAAAWANPLQPVQTGNVIYLTGGIGSDERATLEAAKKDYNLQVTSSNAAAELEGPTSISISDRQGNELVKTQSGPLFYANLPAGSYTVVQTKNGEAKSKTVTVSENKASNLHFIWK